MGKPKPEFTQEEIISALSELLAEKPTEDGYLFKELIQLCRDNGMKVHKDNLRRGVQKLVEEGKLKSVWGYRSNVHGDAYRIKVLKLQSEI